MRLRMGVGGNARPIGFIGRPVDKARVMLWDEDRPFGAWQLAGLPFAPPGRIERDLTARFSVDIGARVSRVCQHMINRGVARVDPPDRCTIMGLHRKGQALVAQPKPDPTDRTKFGKAREDGADCRGHRRIGVKADLAVLLAPDEAHRQTATQFAARGFVADAAEQASPQDVQLGLTHRAFQAEHQSVVEHCRVVDPIGVPIRVSVRPQRSSKRYQSALLRARRETSRPSTIPAWPSATSAVSRAKPLRSIMPEPETPRSSSITRTCCAGHPSSAALATKAYWRAVDSRLCSTCARLDCRR